MEDPRYDPLEHPSPSPPSPGRAGGKLGGWLPLGLLGVVVGAGLAGALYPLARCELGRHPSSPAAACSREQEALGAFALEVSRILAGVVLGASFRTGL